MTDNMKLALVALWDIFIIVLEVWIVWQKHSLWWILFSLIFLVQTPYWEKVEIEIVENKAGANKETK